MTTGGIFRMKKGKRYAEAAKLVDRTKLYDVQEAVSVVKKAANAKFDETIEAHLRLGVDGRQADQQIRGAVVLPHGTGKKVRVLVFAKDAKAEEAKAAGAEYVGAEGLMPNPKAGTVTMDVTKAIEDIKAGKIEYRLDKNNIIHVPVGKASFTEEQLADNFQTLIDAIIKAKPSAAKGQYFKNVTITSTMGPGVKIDTGKFA